MMAMTAAGVMASSPQPISSSRNEEGISRLQEGPVMPIHSGLSALILAATRLLPERSDSSPDETPDRSNGGTGVNVAGDGANSTVVGASTDLPNSSGTPSIVAETEDQDRVSRRTRIKQVSSFPETLMTLLSDERYQDTLTFLPDGKFFAIRAQEFAQHLMRSHFNVATFDEFLELIDGWGFSRINHRQPTFEDIDIHAHATMNINNGSGIHIFRHPRFEKGNPPRDLAKQLTFSHPMISENTARIHDSQPDRTMPESVGTSCYSSDGDTSASSNTKRRLSPTHLKDCEDGTQKRLSLTSVGSLTPPPPLDAPAELPQLSESAVISHSRSNESAENPAAATAPTRHSSSRRSSNDVRSLALAITTEKLNLSCDEEDEAMGSHNDNVNMDVTSAMNKPLVDGAVERATHTIVTDAIESLLRDEGHSRQTYLKHEKELSQSALPGVIPISKQLFSPLNKARQSAALETQPENKDDAISSRMTSPGGSSTHPQTYATSEPANVTKPPPAPSESSKTADAFREPT